VDQALRTPCAVPALPDAPLTETALSQFSLAQGEHGACERDRADKLVKAIDAHNEAAE
jgi:hypothetical protein